MKNSIKNVEVSVTDTTQTFKSHYVVWKHEQKGFFYEIFRV